MMATRSFGRSYGIPAGAWRWAALGFVILALGAAGLALTSPERVLEVYSKIERADHWRVLIERRGAPLTMTITIK